MTAQLPQGFRVAGVRCGIKKVSQNPDLALFVSDVPCVAAGCYTKNHVVAAPVVLDRQRTPAAAMRAVVVNAGNANACTGQRGLDDAHEMARLAALACGVEAAQMLVMSTGIIGEHLPMAKIEAGVQAAVAELSAEPEALAAASRAIMTTDLVPKVTSRSVQTSLGEVRLTGVAKGSGMIGPNMATMLGIVMTDAGLDADDAQDMLTAAVDQSFNCVTVDGHTSTNDTVLFLANGQATSGTLTDGDRDRCGAALTEVCIELAKMIADDGEGATHLVEIHVRGMDTTANARTIAAAIANSPLVKTAIAGADPNWGRIVSAAGYAGPPFDPLQVDLRVNGILLYERGTPVPFDAAEVSASIGGQRETRIEIEFAEGTANVCYWTCDLTKEYVAINADYHT
ncbi:MAG: bifunctional glutamate N-acetyltransferase/amino-acid acetyltransferase ArgJ [Planctomycetales bacterium]|nr:bifunctional glutamate N-acetyltransferase/amino-acid acetyltransferase ArgJ [Planctomycetales bacterium]